MILRFKRAEVVLLRTMGFKMFQTTFQAISGTGGVPTVTPGGVCLGESGGRKSSPVAVAVGEGQ